MRAGELHRTDRREVTLCRQQSGQRHKSGKSGDDSNNGSITCCFHETAASGPRRQQRGGGSGEAAEWLKQRMGEGGGIVSGARLSQAIVCGSWQALRRVGGVWGIVWVLLLSQCCWWDAALCARLRVDTGR